MNSNITQLSYINPCKRFSFLTHVRQSQHDDSNGRRKGKRRSPTLVARLVVTLPSVFWNPTGQATVFVKYLSLTFRLALALLALHRVGVADISTLGVFQDVAAVGRRPVRLFALRLIPWTGVQNTLPFCQVDNLVTSGAQEYVVLRGAELDASNKTSRIRVAIGIVVVCAIVRASIPGVRANLEGLPEGAAFFFDSFHQIKSSVPVRARTKTGNAGYEFGLASDSQWWHEDIVFVEVGLINKEAICLNRIMHDVFSGSLQLLEELVRKTDLRRCNTNNSLMSVLYVAV